MLHLTLSIRAYFYSDKEWNLCPTRVELFKYLILLGADYRREIRGQVLVDELIIHVDPSTKREILKFIDSVKLE